MANKATRRNFLQTSAAVGAGFWVANQLQADDSKSANEEISFGCIGVGGKGTSDSNDAGNNGNVVAICDIDENNLNRAAARFPKAKKFNDYRKMIDEMAKSLDGVTVSTPDHNHAPAALRAMRAGLHCFCQKPMTHTLQEARLMAEVAREKNLATEMGNQGTAESSLREAAAIIRSGALGPLKEAHVWTNRPVWPQGLDRPEKGQDIPAHVSWDQWLGPAQERPYHSAYHPFKWRGWWEFGTGALGDMACHTLNMPFMGADLRHPVAVQATSAGHNKETYPKWSQIVFEFPEAESRGPINFTWYDGGKRPLELLEGRTYKGKKADVYRSGALIIGEKGSLFSGDDYCGAFEVWDIEKPEVEYVKSPGHFQEFARAIKTNNNTPAVSNFQEYAGPLTETVLLGNLAVWAAAEADTPGRRIEWDAKNLVATNAPEVDDVIRKPYRKGWEI